MVGVLLIELGAYSVIENDGNWLEIAIKFCRLRNQIYDIHFEIQRVVANGLVCKLFCKLT